ncbi:MAG: hypothetical protein ABJG68_04130 [Crocinitomicaceae bacterium]
MRTQILIIFTFFYFNSFGNRTDYLVQLIKEAEQTTPLITVNSDHRVVKLSNLSYDDYFKVLNFTPINNAQEKEFQTSLKLHVKGISEIDSSHFRIRLQDIISAAFTNQHKKNNDQPDKLYLSNGDTMDVRITTYDEKEIHYKKYSKDPRVYKKTFYEVERMQFGNHTKVAFGAPPNKRKKNLKAIGQGIGVTLGFSALFFICSQIISD